MEKNIRISQSDVKQLLEKIGVDVVNVERHFVIKSVPFNFFHEKTKDIAIDIAPGYNRIARIAVYTDINDDSNANLNVTKSLQVDGKDVINAGFPTKLLFPKIGNEMFTDLDYNLDGSKSVINLSLEAETLVAAGDELTCYILVVLEKNLD